MEGEGEGEGEEGRERDGEGDDGIWIFGVLSHGDPVIYLSDN